MLRIREFVSALGLCLVMVTLLLALSVPASGGAAPAGKAAAQTSIGAVAPAQAACGQASGTREVSIFERSDGGVCSEDVTQDTPSGLSLVFGRTCRCSCGYPCKTDADCGGAIGSCRAGISCC